MDIAFQTEGNRIFAAGEDGRVIAEVTFPEGPEGIFTIDHTLVDDSLRGQGMAAKLVEAALAEIKSRGGKVQATCSYAVSYLRKKGNPE